MILLLVGGVASLLVVWTMYGKLTTRVCRSKRDMTGQVVIITGANSGIGLETVKDLVRRNAKVIMACRDLQKAAAAAKDILSSTGKPENLVVVKRLDLCSFASVREFAKEIINTETRLDVLINNAGIMFRTSKFMTEDGIDSMMAANHYGHFLLTGLLLPLLKASAPSRIVIVSSELYRFGRINFEDLKGQKIFRDLTTYWNSKLANILHSMELSERLKGTGVTSNSLHPGVVATNLLTNLNPLVAWTSKILKGICGLKTPVEGAQTTIYCAVSEEVEGITGKYFSNCSTVEVSRHAKDLSVARKLWDCSAQITNLEFQT